MLNIIVLTNNSNITNLHVDNYCFVMRLVLRWLWYIKQQRSTKYYCYYSSIKHYLLKQIIILISSNEIVSMLLKSYYIAKMTYEIIAMLQKDYYVAKMTNKIIECCRKTITLLK